MRCPESTDNCCGIGSWGAPGRSGVREWQITSRESRPGTGRPPPDGVDVDYPPVQRFDLRGKTALVTNGNGGIGAGIARGLLGCGASVVIVGRNITKNDEMVAELRTVGPPVSAVAIEQCRDPSSCGCIENDGFSKK